MYVLNWHTMDPKKQYTPQKMNKMAWKMRAINMINEYRVSQKAVQKYIS